MTREKPTTTPTTKQANVLRAIASLTSSTGKPPTYREIASRIGVTSVRTVSKHVGYLVNKGCLVHSPRVRRTLALTELGTRAVASDDAEWEGKQAQYMAEHKATSDRLIAMVNDGGTVARTVARAVDVLDNAPVFDDVDGSRDPGIDGAT